MHTDENKAIRYLMKEMDPSEVMEFEKKIREDEDLLIEVESLRATQRKLSGLPKKNPPKHITKKIASEAKQLQSQKVRKSKTITLLAKRGVAAAVLLAAFYGGFQYYEGTSGSATSQEAVPASATTAGSVTPWVDRNEVLRFNGTETTEASAEMQQELNRSFEKLQLVNDPGSVNGTGSGILLTGSTN
ncbi:hypothetical protein [Gracilimonas mengyeensis]|uniref:Anti sigma-E protein RseA, N-terminal domain n=1 Tax=Gracilimonas mengyeensis TaxID=1302730 RepID=A0A521EQ73_9BACT|nr:hypothetical protein [Gracilimonas mengyeensis]SMO86052.1 hypothetical protein SAMN06265219_11334 [Gracilimonas mengyeensis]